MFQMSSGWSESIEVEMGIMVQKYQMVNEETFVKYIQGIKFRTFTGEVVPSLGETVV